MLPTISYLELGKLYYANPGTGNSHSILPRTKDTSVAGNCGSGALSGNLNGDVRGFMLQAKRDN